MSEVRIRPARMADADACGGVIYAAFGAVNERHGYRSRWPTESFATNFAADFIARRGIFAIVAELDGRVVGCNFLDERSPVGGIGPTAVAPTAQRTGIGRALMEGVTERRDGPVRLLQDSFNTASLALYASLGFEVREPIALVSGVARNAPSDASVARRIDEQDLRACGELCHRVHGFDRTRELADALEDPDRAPLLISRDGQVIAYSSGFGTFAHAVAYTHEDMRDLLLAAATDGSRAPLECLIPMRHAELFNWALDQGFAIDKTMNLMTLGAYEEPAGTWCPSVLY